MRQGDKTMNLNKIDEYLLRKIFKKIVIQSIHHEENVIRCMELLAIEVREEFFEDNYITNESFFMDCASIGYNKLKGKL